MANSNLNELNESIELLSCYRDRLKKEVITISNKLQIPQDKINSTLKKHSELTEVNQAISQLLAHREKQLNEAKN